MEKQGLGLFSMTLEEIAARDNAPPARLRPADVSSRQPAGQPAGPFEVAVRKGAGLRETLMTGLLVIYPAFATVAAIVAGFWLKSAGA